MTGIEGDAQPYRKDGIEYGVVQASMVYDIAALQYLYGANMSHNSGNNTYFYKPDTPFIETIWDAGGTDTLDFSNFSKASTISLIGGEYSTIGFDVDWSMSNNLGIAFNATIENASGGAGSDNITGNPSGNILKGNAGDDTIRGKEGNDQLHGDGGNDFLYGDGGNDTIFADGGSDTIQGGAGLDTIKYALSQANYTLAVGESSSTLREISTGTNDSLSTVERVVFSDKAVALDIGSGEVGGSCYRIYKAAFNRTPDEGGLGYWIGQMDLGKTLVEVSAGFIDSDEFRASYGTNPSNGEFLTKVYNNVLGRDPDSGGYDWWVDQLANNPEKTWDKVMADFSEGTENQANVLELIGNGVQYDLWVAQALHVLFMAAKLFLRQATGHLIGTNKAKLLMTQSLRFRHQRIQLIQGNQMADLTVIEDTFYMPFNRYIDSHGLRIFVLDDISNSFIRKVAATYEAMLAMNAFIDIETRTTVKETLQSNYVYQRVGVESPAYYGGGINIPSIPSNGNYRDNLTDYIWETTSRTAASQTSEVIEHLLHTITTIGFNLIFPEWKWADSSSSINLAMQQAIDGGYYDVSSYAFLIDSHPETYMKTIVTEFSYWLVLAEWEYFELTDKSNNNTEFTLRTASDIADKLPLAHQLYLDTFAKVFSAPDKTLIQALFSNETPYDFSTHTGLESVTGTAIADQLYGNELNNTITGRDGNDTIFADGGSDTIEGGTGLDTIKYTLSQANYTLALGESSSTVTEISTGANDSFSTIERVVFSDKAVALDIGSGEVGGSCYRIYKAAFNRTPDEGGLGYWIGQMDLGKTLVEVSAGFIDSDEFRASYGTNPSNGEFLTKVYNNVLGRDPDSGGYDWWVDQLANNPEKTWDKVMADFSEGTENQANVLELISNGVQYDLWVAQAYYLFKLDLSKPPPAPILQTHTFHLADGQGICTGRL